jgi:hypothetical protein
LLLTANRRRGNARMCDPYLHLLDQAVHVHHSLRRFVELYSHPRVKLQTHSRTAAGDVAPKRNARAHVIALAHTFGVML